VRNWKTIATVIVMIATFILLGGVVASSPSQGEPVDSFALSPPEVPVLIGDTTEGGQGVSDFALTEEEKTAAMHIIESDAHVGGILQNLDWHVTLIGPMTQGNQKIGAAVLITFDGAVWMEDTFSTYYPSGYSYAAKLWVGSMHILVDLRDGRIAGFAPTGMGRAPITSPITSSITSEERAAAAEISLSTPVARALGENVEAYLNAVYYTDDYPQGIAFFNVRSDQGEAFVAIDLDKMMVAEQYTSRVESLER
jgi:hypothetical protein